MSFRKEPRFRRPRATPICTRARIALSIGAAMMVGALIMVYIGANTADPGAPVVTPITLTRVVTDARAGALAGAVVDENELVIQVTYGPGGPPSSPAGDGGVLSPGSLASANVLAAYLPQLVDTLVSAGVPVRVGPVPHPDAATGTTRPPASRPGATATTPATTGSLGWALGLGLALMLGALAFIAAGLVLHDRHERSAALRRKLAAGTSAGSAASLGGDGKPSRFGDKKAPIIEPAIVPDTRFSDVAGADEAKAELAELVMFLKEPARYTRTGAKAPKGALLTGPPGTGKTLLARAVAGEAGVPMFTATGSDFVEKYVGVGAGRVRALFAAARTHDRAIVFIDEVDAVARCRGGSGSGSNAESESTLIALLSEMDGFHASNVIVIAATNRADTLDPALTRAGRLDRRVEMPNPDRRGREQILAVHTTGKPIADGVDFTALARRTPGFSGAQLAALVNEACIDAVRRDLDTVTAECFDHAVATIAMGRARTSALVTDHDREVTAWHESGHTLAAYLQEHSDDPVQVTIIPRGPAGGLTWMSGNDNQFLARTKAHAQLVTGLAGRAAEEILLDGEFTQGASGDLASATDLATAMVTQYGMTRLGYQVRRGGPGSTGGGAVVVEELLADAHANATKLLRDHKTFLAAVATELLDAETLTLADVHAIATRLGVARHAHVPAPAPPAQIRATNPAPAGGVPATGVAKERPAPPRSAPRRRFGLVAAILGRRTRRARADADN